MILWILLALMLLLALQGALFMQIALRRKKKRRRKPSAAPRKASGPASFRMERPWLKAQPQQNIYMQSFDQLKLRARLVPNGDCRRFAILCHGYGAHSASMALFGRKLFERGFALLMPDARAHGESEGKWVGMGWPERLDVLAWIGELNRRFDSPQILLFGVSMGGATVMNAAGEALPENVRCVIEDCGFSSTRGALQWRLGHSLHLPVLPFMLGAEPLCRLLAGYSLLRDGDVCAQLRRCRLPALFIHGTADSFVPTAMLDQVYAAAAGPKEKLAVAGAGHADSAVQDPEGYWAAVDKFLARHMPCSKA